jgi:hypothetical protein
MCPRILACAGQAGLTAMGYTSVAQCTSGMQASNCATPAAAGCDPGQTYHADQAQACVNAVPVWSCTDMTAGTNPAPCDLVCS